MFFNFAIISLLYLTLDGANLPNGKKYYDLELAETYFTDFIKTYNKTYDSEAEYKMRFDIFKKSLETINYLNEKHVHASFAVRSLADNTEEEWEMLKGFRPLKVPSVTFPSEQYENIDVPDSVDWRDKNGVTPVKNQGTCGSCWAFSTIAVIESQVAIKHKQILDLSEQLLVDCVRDDNGCGGGMPSDAFEYMQYKSGGAMLESDYKYQARNGGCKLDKSKVVVKVNNTVAYYYVNDVDMAKLIVSYGPISVALCMSQELRHYKSGVMVPDDCNGNINHAVTIVGYGTENGIPYWIIKNSWGRGWGDSGYFKLARGKNLCQIGDYVAIGTIE